MKKVSSTLAAKGLKVTVLTAPGWVASRSNVETLSVHIEHSLMQHPDAVVVLDLLGNSSARCVQSDDSLSGAGKLHCCISIWESIFPMNFFHQ